MIKCYFLSNNIAFKLRILFAPLCKLDTYQQWD